MSKEDFAILTCISRYPNPGFSLLTGPLNDLRIVEEWLIDPARGALLPENVKKIQTPKPYPQDQDPQNFDPNLAPPRAEEFHMLFRKLLKQRMDMGRERVTGRLYLYFSGHGFCNRSQEKPAEAALYTADASREIYEHIFGTHYARVAVSWALFKEVVLIMDCCRDSEIARVPTPKPFRDTPDDGLAADVQFLSIYAVPKGGKAQEKPIPERNGDVHGLLTHVLLKLLDEIVPSNGHLISATELRGHLLANWDALCGEDPAPRPEVYLPPAGEIYFPTKNLGSPFEFRWNNTLPIDASLTLVDSTFQDVAVFPLGTAGNPSLSAGGPVVSHIVAPGVLKLRMKLGLYQFRVSGPAVRQGIFKVDGSDGYVNL
jgi:hypothetical protein